MVRRRRPLSYADRLRWEALGREGFLIMRMLQRDRYNAKRREERDARRARVADLLERDPAMTTKALAEITGVSVRTARRDREAVRMGRK